MIYEAYGSSPAFWKEVCLGYDVTRASQTAMDRGKGMMFFLDQLRIEIDWISKNPWLDLISNNECA